MKIHQLRCDYLHNPLGIDNLRPRLSWKLQSSEQGKRQSAYQITVVCGQHNVWDSGKVTSSQSIHVPYDGQLLRSRQRYIWRVRVWDELDVATNWSEEAWWEMGLLTPAEWEGNWIEPTPDFDPERFNPAPYLRQSFDLAKKTIVSARVYATAHGIYDLFINGQRVGDQLFAPGWTSYHKRLQYQVYDVTGELQGGENIVGAILADGWWRGEVGPQAIRNAWGNTLGLLLQLMVTYEDGTVQTVASDDSWRWTTGPYLEADMMEGEIYDARLEMPGWNRPGYDAASWQRVRTVSYPLDNLIAESSPKIRQKETFRPTQLITTPTGQRVIDFGQNFAGIARLTLRGIAGETITLRHQEWLNQDGTFHVEKGDPVPGIGVKMPQQRNIYTFKSNEAETYEPRFALAGFRYLLIEGYSGDIDLNQIEAVATYSDMPETGQFECSDPDITKLHQNVKWGQKSNFIDVPTDCPTRERGGWTGDAQVFARTGSTLMDTAAFFRKWLQDLAADQLESGKVPNMIPDFYQAAGRSHPIFNGTSGSAGWGDAAVIIPWELYQVFGDSSILEQQYESMVAWFSYVHSLAQRLNWHRWLSPVYWLNNQKRQNYRSLWDTKFHFGEWLEPGITMPQMFLGLVQAFTISRPVVASAYYKHICDLLAATAAVLNKPDDVARFLSQSERVKQAYGEEFIGADGKMRPDRQATYVRALQFNLVPDELRKLVVDRLVGKIRANGNHVGTGFLSTGFLCHVLTEHGLLNVAYDLLNQRTRPSWLYAIDMGATTIWEGWDTVLPDGERGMGSHNHYSKGAVADWLYRVVAGIEIGEPGYKHIIIRPQPGGGLTSARGSIESMYGEIISSWQIRDGVFDLNVTIPPNTTAEIHLPDLSEAIHIGSGAYSMSCPLTDMV